jgi:hypothetical protein
VQNKFITSILYVLASILLVVGPQTIFKVCKLEEIPKKCYWSARAEIGIAIILVIIAVLYFLAKTIRGKVFIAIVAIVNGIVAILIPSFLIGGCEMKTMPCQSRTFPAFYDISAALIIFSLSNIFYLLKIEKENG